MQYLKTVNWEWNRLLEEDPAKKFHFEDVADNPTKTNFNLIVGDFNFDEVIPHYDNIVQLTFEEPNRFCVYPSCVNSEKHEKSFYKILTLDPYMAEFLNKVQNRDLRVPMFLPFSKRYIPTDFTKSYDVNFSGHINNSIVADWFTKLKNTNRCIVSHSKTRHTTHADVSYVDKILLNSRSKMSIVYNVLLCIRKEQIQTPYILKCKSFEHLESLQVVPQLKARLFEAAFCKSLILCYKDPWNLIETWFNPYEDFIYFNDADHLNEIVEHVTHNYNMYVPIVESAFNKAINNYTTHHFFDRYLKNL